LKACLPYRTAPTAPVRANKSAPTPPYFCARCQSCKGIQRTMAASNQPRDNTQCASKSSQCQDRCNCCSAQCMIGSERADTLMRVADISATRHLPRTLKTPVPASAMQAYREGFCTLIIAAAAAATSLQCFETYGCRNVQLLHCFLNRSDSDVVPANAPAAAAASRHHPLT
jgi:hypothetical protein